MRKRLGVLAHLDLKMSISSTLTDRCQVMLMMVIWSWLQVLPHRRLRYRLQPPPIPCHPLLSFRSQSTTFPAPAFTRFNSMLFMIRHLLTRQDLILGVRPTVL